MKQSDTNVEGGMAFVTRGDAAKTQRNKPINPVVPLHEDEAGGRGGMST